MATPFFYAFFLMKSRITLTYAMFYGIILYIQRVLSSSG